MQINKIDAQNFEGINANKAGGIFFERLNKPKRYIKFSLLEMSQAQNPFNINIQAGKYKNFIGYITDSRGNVLYTKEENALRGILNLSPIKFIFNLCKKASELNVK